MRVSAVVRASVAGLVMTSGLAMAAPAGGPLKALARIEAGQWQLKALDAQTAPRTICIGNARALIQYDHGAEQCQHTLVANDYNVTTVQYSCPGTGHGLTSVKVATQTNFNLETQGIVNGAPFDEQYEARRIGACPAGIAPIH